MCESLTSVNLPNSITSIGTSAFEGCTGLTSIAITASMTSIGNEVFQDCSNLKDIYYGGSESEWAKIVIGYDNEPLINATIHYNSYNAEDGNQPDINSFNIYYNKCFTK